MIQAVNFSNNNYSTKANTNPSFAQKAEPGFVDYRADEFEKPKKKVKQQDSSVISACSLQQAQ